ncbi:MAG: MurR/RpiR family transcriptional regulator [Desulfuromonadales bacterium]|nr:MurR/RpiR family transcriptional regulator [Desulfuromonadales bacterium]MCK4691240.1 MurR/RpiR family transcriptional regulator [Desulfuromonadales bacterium]
MNKKSIDGDLFSRVRALKKLTPTQFKIVDWFRNNENSLAFENLIALSAKSGVSKASMVRFLIHVLGYRDFAEFQCERQKKMAQRLESPIMCYLNSSDDALGGESTLMQHVPYSLQAIQCAYNFLDITAFTQISNLLAQAERPLYLMGHRTSYALASLAYTNLQYIRPNVHMLGDAHSSFPPEIFNVGKGDIALIISRRRYSQNSLNIARELKNIGTELVLLTDAEVTPLSHLADIQLVVQPPEKVVFESLAAWTVILEAMTLNVADKCRRTNPDYSVRAEKIVSEFFGFSASMMEKVN